MSAMVFHFFLRGRGIFTVFKLYVKVIMMFFASLIDVMGCYFFHSQRYHYNYVFHPSLIDVLVFYFMQKDSVSSLCMKGPIALCP